MNLQFHDCLMALKDHTQFGRPNNAVLLDIVLALISNFNRSIHAARAPADMAKTGLWIYKLWIKSNGDTEKFSQLQQQEQNTPDDSLDGLAEKIVFNGGDYDAGTSVHGLTAILFGIITNSWASFEILAGDLWEACLNERPRLALQTILDQSDLPVRDRIAVPTYLFLESNFNFANSMGKIVRASRRFDFSRKDETEKAYLRVFPQEKSRIQKIFNAPALRWLAALRNVVVHNAGKADREFLRLVHDCPQLAAVPAGSPIPIDGKLAGELSSSAFAQAKELVQLVDDWLSANPK